MKKLICQYLFRTAMVMLSIFFFTICSQAQTIDSTLATYSTKYAQERAYLHYDKSSYAPGETIWFKAYLMQGLELADGSKTFYIDWVDEKGTVLLHSVCPVVQSVTNGQFDIPENYTGSAIHVRAYTRWMLNFDTAFLYQKSIRILSKTPATAKVAPVTSLEFFPEGGDAVAGIRNRIAFKAADQWGRPVSIKGVILNSAGKVVDSLRSIHDGMGSFFLQPEGNATYTAKWKEAKGVEKTTPLPVIKPTGIAMQVGISGTRRIVAVNRPADAPDNLKQLYLVGTMHQNMVFKTGVNLSTELSGTKMIPTETLPTGILTITVFDAGWNAIAERITFINNNDYSFPTEMNVAHWGLSKRGRDEIEVTVPAGITANLSVSVTDAGIAADSSSNIFSHLLLTSEIKGRVYRPAYYFSNNSDTVRQQMDLVMLTNGWRRFKWEDVVKGKFPTITYPKDSTYLTLSGKVIGVHQSQLGAGSSIIMIVKQNDSASKMLMMPIDTKGNFSDPEMVFFDSLKIYYQFPKNKGLSSADVRFMSDRLAALNYSKNFSPFATISDTTGSYRHMKLAGERASLMEMQKVKMLENVTVSAKTKPTVQVMDEKYTSGLFKGADAYQFDLLNDPFAASSLNIFQYLQGKVAGLQITQSGGGASMQWRGGSPQLYLDEIQTDVDMISGIPVSDVAYIKVFRPPFMGGSGGGNGAIAIYTRRGGDVQSTPGKGLASNKVIGYTPIKQFYAPNYSSFQQRNEERDLRTTLYWNPMLVTTPGKQTVMFTFYNNDVSQSFRVVIEGMSSDGKLTRLEQIME
ncbi:hypothetical protein OCK74_16275 [Chitinophagaceae bacterium LB-8]|uniref:TonB-dependent receptor plug domain-containing protein n=1 Tax=Paraflavisolibacter caeni TaxID=2982496 RepID=A0A9X2XXT8_9BACT|nr:hypothetical protein [Paraflavisolibacter caeni]MCU7550677.1 hypothetical protein [Paraflavisolibacter caeni]